MALSRAPSGPRPVEGRKRGAPYQTGLGNTEGTKSVLAGPAERQGGAGLWGRGLQADGPWRLGLVNGNAVCRVVPRVGEGVRELAHTEAWAPWPVTHVAYVSTGSSCMVALPSPVGLSIPSGKFI